MSSDMYERNGWLNNVTAFRCASVKSFAFETSSNNLRTYEQVIGKRPFNSDKSALNKVLIFLIGTP